MSSLRGLVLATVLLGTSPSAAAIVGPVKIDGGQIAGVAAGKPGVVAFKAVPYAAPPVGALRWRPPQPAVVWPGVRKADKFGPDCIDTPAPKSTWVAQSEDCLNLNLWTGASSPQDKRPVIVWLHGAAFGASDPLFDGAALAAKGVIVVAVNYRSGVFGYLSTPELDRESEHGTSGNYGLLDGIAALKWVQRNIAAFGGDPARVTLAGESLGSGATNFIVLSPEAKGLFTGAIMQSHARYPRDPELFAVALRYQTRTEAQAAGAKLMQTTGAGSLQDLRALPAEKLAAAGGFNKNVDGWLIPKTYAETYATGGQANVSILAGSNRDESGAMPDSAFDLLIAGVAPSVASAMPPTKLADYLKIAGQKYGPMAAEFLKLYPAGNDREAFTAYSQAIRDNSRVSMWMWAGAWREKATKPVHLYFFGHTPPERDHAMMGAYHGSEISYAFGHLHPVDAAWTPADEKLADTMSSYWSNFAKTGDPNGLGLPRWPAFDPKVQQVMSLGDRFEPMLLADPAKLDFWKRYYATQPPR